MSSFPHSYDYLYRIGYGGDSKFKSDNHPFDTDPPSVILTPDDFDQWIDTINPDYPDIINDLKQIKYNFAEKLKTSPNVFLYVSY